MHLVSVGQNYSDTKARVTVIQKGEALKDAKKTSFAYEVSHLSNVIHAPSV